MLLPQLEGVMFLIVEVSEQNKLIPLSVFMLPHLLVFRKFESGNDLDVRIDDWVPVN